MKLRLSLLVLVVTVGVFTFMYTRPTLRAEPEAVARETSLEAEIKVLQEIRAKELEQIQKIKNLLAKEREKINKEVATTEKKLQEMRNAYSEMTNKLTGMGVSLEVDKLNLQGVFPSGVIGVPGQPYYQQSPFDQSTRPIQTPTPMAPTVPPQSTTSG